MANDDEIEALRHAVRSLGGDVVDGAIILPSGRSVPVAVRRVGAVDAALAERLATSHGPDEPTIVVADLIPQTLRPVLNDAGVSWLDRRGHLRVAVDDVWIDADTPPTPRPTPARRRAAVSGPAQISVAAAHLVGWRLGVRELARRIGLSATAVSRARARLVEAGLLEPSGDPAIPELFWALAEAWQINWETLAAVPSPDAVTLIDIGSASAAQLGASIVTTKDWPIDLVGVDAPTVERVRLRVGVTGGPGPCRLGVAPTPLVADPELVGDLDPSGFPIGHQLFLALELAQDPARGREALATWEPEGFDRVW
jgi:hypothetical protein